MKRTTNPFKWRHFEPEIILLCVRWYCRFQLSYRDLEAMMQERGRRFTLHDLQMGSTLCTGNQQAHPPIFEDVNFTRFGGHEVYAA